jgi:aspartate kinase
MIVMKFGGTSVGNAERIQQVARLVRERRERRPVVVVSALGGVTSRLLETVNAAVARDDGARAAHLSSLREIHLAAVDGLGLSSARRDRARNAVLHGLGAIDDATCGMLLLGEQTPRASDAVAAMGEQLSHVIVALALEEIGADAVAVDPRLVMRTDARHGSAEPDRLAIAALAREHLAPLVAAGRIPVTGGYVGATEDGVTTTLGRGGSDYSASLLGAALGADEVQIWTDVPGMMTADPRVVPNARTLPRVSFAEAAELAYFGARVLHPATIRPAVERCIPVHVLDTFHPELGGTVVDDEGDDAPGPRVRAVAWRKGIAMMSIGSPRMLGSHGFLARVFDVFGRHETAVDVVTTSEVSISVTVDQLHRIDAIQHDLTSFCEARIERGRALVCLVGRGLLESPRLVSEVLATLDPIPLRMFCLGSSDINLTFVVDEGNAEECVQRLHARFLENP